MRRVYLDNNATTPVPPAVLAAMQGFFGEHFGNASSIHHHGQETRAAVERARESIAALVGCRPSEIVFTSGGTEGDNLAIFGLVKSGDHIITSTVEHHAVLNSCKQLQASGCEVTYVPVDGDGRVNPDDVRRALRPNTRLITIMMANNETGVLQPVEEIGKIAGKLNADFKVVRPDVEITDEDALVACSIPNELEAVHMDQLAAQAARSHARVDQIHPQYRIVLLHIRTEEQ